MTGKSTHGSSHVFRAINRITAAFAKAGIAKSHCNLQDQYLYRSIDDVLNRLSPLLCRHALCVLPRVLERHAEDRTGDGDTLLVSVRLLVAFDLVSCRDASSHTIQAWGEALDASDKGTAKAMSAAYKSAMLQVFCVPVASDDADATTHRLKIPTREREPVQGWDAWSADIVDMIGICESLDAIDRIRTRHRGLLEALKQERPDLYAAIGERASTRAGQLIKPPANTAPVSKTPPLPADSAAPAEPEQNRTADQVSGIEAVNA